MFYIHLFWLFSHSHSLFTSSPNFPSPHYQLIIRSHTMCMFQMVASPIELHPSTIFTLSSPLHHLCSTLRMPPPPLIPQSQIPIIPTRWRRAATLMRSTTAIVIRDWPSWHHYPHSPFHTLPSSNLITAGRTMRLDDLEKEPIPEGYEEFASTGASSSTIQLRPVQRDENGIVCFFCPPRSHISPIL